MPVHKVMYWSEAGADMGGTREGYDLGELGGVGIYLTGVLEAVYVGGNLSMGQIASMTQGIL